MHTLVRIAAMAGTTLLAARATLGPLALTRMMCLPDAIGQHWPQDVERIDSYRLTDGRLQRTVSGNGGSYTWERVQP